MAANQTLLQGRIIEDPDKEPKDLEGLIRGFFEALQEENQRKDQEKGQRA